MSDLSGFNLLLWNSPWIWKPEKTQTCLSKLFLRCQGNIKEEMHFWSNSVHLLHWNSVTDTRKKERKLPRLVSLSSRTSSWIRLAVWIISVTSASRRCCGCKFLNQPRKGRHLLKNGFTTNVVQVSNSRIYLYIRMVYYNNNNKKPLPTTTSWSDVILSIRQIAFSWKFALISTNFHHNKQRTLSQRAEKLLETRGKLEQASCACRLLQKFGVLLTWASHCQHPPPAAGISD